MADAAVTQPQGDALVDVFVCCSDVTAAWNHRTLVARNSKRKTGAVKALQKEVSSEYQKSKEKLNGFFQTALIKGCSRQTLDTILMDNLPTAVLRDIMSD